jgi:glycylpeptide N-tetradecanoyltransferase
MAPEPKDKMPASAENDPATTADKGKQPVEDHEDESGDTDDDAHAGEAGAAGSSKKKRKKRSKKKKAAAASDDGTDATMASLKKSLNNLNDEQLQELLKMNPALAGELKGSGATTDKELADKLRKMNIQEVMAGLSSSGKNIKDMGAYKFWKTQPVPKFGEGANQKEGPMMDIKREDVSENPDSLPDGFEWVTMNLLDEKELMEVHDLLEGHYVEDDTAMLRFNYSFSILRW